MTSVPSGRIGPTLKTIRGVPGGRSQPAAGKGRAVHKMVNSSAPRLPDDRPRATFVLEQTLGHVTHGQNLRALLADHPLLRATFVCVPFEVSGIAAKVPGFSNWTIRSAFRARRAIRRQWRRGGIDVMFIHTHVPAFLTVHWMKRIPTIVSLDATPEQYDELGVFYDHHRSSSRTEFWKKEAAKRCYRRAGHIVAWSAWARDSLVDNYGVDPDRITVITPGVHIERWARTEPAQAEPVTGDDSDRTSAVVKVLFVGGDLHRKGAMLLIEAARRLHEDASVPAFELHLVTPGHVEEERGLIVHGDLKPNSADLIALYHASHIFCLPTLGDCLPMVLSEAGVAGLALLTTDVGAIREIVEDEHSGLLVPPGDLEALVVALRRLVIDPELRARLGEAAQDTVRRRFDARANAEKVVEVLRRIAPPVGMP